MIYRFTFFFIGIFAFCQGFSQAPNLVPNGSFEQRTNCIYNDSDVEDAPPWFSPTAATPDVFHQCAVVNDDPCPLPEIVNMDPWFVGVPANFIGCEEPYDGVGYAGYYAFGPNVNGYDGYKEYLGVRLSQPLTAGDEYTIKLNLSLPDLIANAVWNIQVYFGPDSIAQDNDTYINVNPQLSGDSGQYITNYDGWHEMAWDYTASGDETFMYIGNFQPDSQTDTVILYAQNPNLGFSYYYIDDIQVRAGTLSLSQTVEENNFQIFPNPTDGVFTINSPDPIVEIQLFDTQGRLVYNKKGIASGQNHINITGLTKGIYCLKATTMNNNHITRKIVKR